jgi:hypothetical protein
MPNDIDRMANVHHGPVQTNLRKMLRLRARNSETCGLKQNFSETPSSWVSIYVAAFSEWSSGVIVISLKLHAEGSSEGCSYISIYIEAEWFFLPAGVWRGVGGDTKAQYGPLYPL